MLWPPHQPTVADELAGRWMHRGIDLLQANSWSSLREAARCFDQAIALRRALPLAENPRRRYGLAAGWMNRGDALARLGGIEQLAEAVSSYDKALECLRDLPLGDDSLYPRRLAIAWINRGFAWQRGDTATARSEAIRSFRNALAVLEDSPASAIADLALLRAGALTNLAGALLDASDSSAPEARSLARQALGLIESGEQNDTPAAEVGFKARHVLCRAIAAESRDGKTAPLDRLSEASDAARAGLALARHWERRGETGFRALAEDLFRFGCRVYQAGPPQFLVEFILESLDPARSGGAAPLNGEMRDSAIAALWAALKDIQRAGFSALSTPRRGHLLESLRILRVAEERLEQLRGTTIHPRSG